VKALRRYCYGGLKMTKIHEVLIVGGGASGLATASSLRKRNPKLDITVIEPAEKHYYQPGWTMVGAGVFNKEQTERTMDSVWPSGIKRIKSEVVTFEPDNSLVTITSGEKISYKILVVAAGLKLDWEAVEGLEDALGSNGVTSNYRYDLAPYTWELFKRCLEKVQFLRNHQCLLNVQGLHKKPCTYLVTNGCGRVFLKI